MNHKDILCMRQSMERMSVIIVGYPVRVANISIKEGVAYSRRNKNDAMIGICFDYPFKNSTEDEKKVYLYGLYAHELMHLIRTDFDYVTAQIKSFPIKERHDRHSIWNIMEDPAIEYFSEIEVSEFLHSCLMKTIAYFHKESPTLPEAGKDAYEEFIASMVMFGDVGYLKGDFTYPEARDCFIQCAPIILETTEQPDARLRFDRSQEIFEIARPLWEEHNKNLLSNSSLDDLLKNLGVTASSGTGGASSNSDGVSDNASAERKRKIIHLITESQAKEKGLFPPADEKSGNMEGSGDPQEMYAVESNSTDGMSLSAMGDDYLIIDERDTKKDSLDTQKSQDESNNKTDYESGSDNEENASKSEKTSSGKSGEDLENSKTQSSSTDDTDQQNSASSGDAKTSNDSNNQEAEQSASEENGVDKNDCSSSGLSLKEMLGKMLAEISESFQNEAEVNKEGAITKQDIEALKDALRSAKEAAEREATQKQKSVDMENIQIEVKTPYYTDVSYQTVKMPVGSDTDYALLYKPVQRYIINFFSRLKKIFDAPHAKTEYRTSGKIDINRLSGRKMTARIFNKRTRPDDKENLSMVILVDQSGSMHENMQHVKETCALILEAFSKFDVPIKVVGFNSVGRYCNSGNSDAVYYHYGSWENNKSLRQSIVNMKSEGCTFLGHAIRYAGCLLEKRPERHKIFIVITDGCPEHSIYKNSSHAMNDCRYAVSDISKFADVIGIGLFTTEKEKEAFRFVFRDNAISMKNTDTLVKELPKMISNLIKKY